MTFKTLPFIAITLLMALPACSGGGGGSVSPPVPVPMPPVGPGPISSPPNPSPSSSTNPVPNPISTSVPTPVPTSTPVVTTLTTGKIVDLPYGGPATNTGVSVVNGAPAPEGAPISGATVIIGPLPYRGVTAPATVSTGYVMTKTDALGGFSFTNVQIGQQVITVFADSPHTVALHQNVNISSTPNTLGSFYLTSPTSDESGWFALTNADRAKYNVAPNTPDEAALESARYWSQFMAKNNYFAHCIPVQDCESGNGAMTPATYGPQDKNPTTRFMYVHGYTQSGEGENIALGFTTYKDAEAAFMAESANCPNGQPQGCPFNASTGHFLNIEDTRYSWMGMAVTSDTSGRLWYDQEFSYVYTGFASSSAMRYTSGLKY